ncbi:MAG TPA: trehalase family glycosidase, partial [Sphingobacteriaceae bacterium]
MLKNTLRTILALLSLPCFAQKPYLSDLRADKNFPLYATYAAPMQRSNFVLDEGYEFRFYVDSLGADFITDTGGDLALGFKIDNKWIYNVRDMFKAPVITSSYPDMVKYEFYPAKDIRVEAFFAVHSSTAALLDIKVFNQRANRSKITVVPFMRNSYRTFSQVRTQGNKITFNHEEYPDGGTTSHKLPFTDSIQNVFLISEKPDFSGAFTSENHESPSMPFPVVPGKAMMQVTGRTYLPGKVRIPDAGKTVRLQLFADDDHAVMITERSPVPGAAQAAIDNGGYFRLETALLHPKAKKYTIAAEHSGGRSGIISGDLNEKTERRKDVDLIAGALPASVGEPQITLSKGSAILRWNSVGKDVKYSVYRRQYPEAVYRRVADRIDGTAFTDRRLSHSSTYGYVIVAHQDDKMSVHSPEVTTIPKIVFSDLLAKEKAPDAASEYSRIVAFTKSLELEAGASAGLRVVRAVASRKDDPQKMHAEAEALLKNNLQHYLSDNEKLFAATPVPSFKDSEKSALYWSANSMMRQVFYPAEGKSKYNYYVFSREPTWGWGHGGQVFHESIAMLAYAYIDPVSAMNSQRVYLQRQYPNGYINYRTGSYLDEIIEHNGQLTSSAPWYSWLNWEVYKITKDEVFLREMYGSSKKFFEFYVKNRDSDKDGLCEWGGEAILESVRDALVAVWDQVGYPTNFESLDLNCMLVMEAKSLEAMARKLGLQEEADRWKADHEKRAALINKTFWDEENGFYYNVDKTTHRFTFKKENDLKRDEIIGFLPLWAGIADKDRAARLVKKLTDPEQFWRPFGVPSLSAKDPYYNAKGYWNGPVWVEWDYLIMRGLLDYGYKTEAKVMVDRVAKGMTTILKKDHNLWEFY